MFYVPAAKDKRMKVFPFRRMFVKISNILNSFLEILFLNAILLILKYQPLNVSFLFIASYFSELFDVEFSLPLFKFLKYGSFSRLEYLAFQKSPLFQRFSKISLKILVLWSFSFISSLRLERAYLALGQTFCRGKLAELQRNLHCLDRKFESLFIRDKKFEKNVSQRPNF